MLRRPLERCRVRAGAGALRHHRGPSPVGFDVTGQVRWPRFFATNGGTNDATAGSGSLTTWPFMARRVIPGSRFPTTKTNCGFGQCLNRSPQVCGARKFSNCGRLWMRYETSQPQMEKSYLGWNVRGFFQNGNSRSAPGCELLDVCYPCTRWEVADPRNIVEKFATKPPRVSVREDWLKRVLIGEKINLRHCPK